MGWREKERREREEKEKQWWYERGTRAITQTLEWLPTTVEGYREARDKAMAAGERKKAHEYEARALVCSRVLKDLGAIEFNARNDWDRNQMMVELVARCRRKQHSYTRWLPRARNRGHRKLAHMLAEGRKMWRDIAEFIEPWMDILSEHPTRLYPPEDPYYFGSPVFFDYVMVD